MGAATARGTEQITHRLVRSGRQRFAHQVAAELAELREDPQAWQAYLAEADDTSVTDGIG